VGRLDNCVVLDWRTWTCGSSDESGQLIQRMDRGEFFESYQGPLKLPVTVYIPAWRYYWHDFTWKPSG